MVRVGVVGAGFAAGSHIDALRRKLAHFPGGHPEGWPDALRNLFEDFYGAIAAERRGEAYTPSFATFADATESCS